MIALIVGLEDRLEQRALRSEGSEQSDFIHAGFGGDETGRRASEAMLAVNASGRLQDSFSADHAPDSSANTCVCKYLLTFRAYYLYVKCFGV